jgi:hypothetical protein
VIAKPHGLLSRDLGCIYSYCATRYAIVHLDRYLYRRLISDTRGGEMLSYSGVLLSAAKPWAPADYVPKHRNAVRAGAVSGFK